MDRAQTIPGSLEELARLGRDGPGLRVEPRRRWACGALLGERGDGTGDPQAAPAVAEEFALQAHEALREAPKRGLETAL